MAFSSVLSDTSKPLPFAPQRLFAKKRVDSYFNTGNVVTGQQPVRVNRVYPSSFESKSTVDPITPRQVNRSTL